MSYASEAAKVGRIPFVYLEAYITSCSHEYGVAPCTAAIGVTGDDKCYHTYSGCQDKLNFGETIKTYRFCQKDAQVPVGFSAIPLIKSITYASQEITPGKGLGVRGSVSIRMDDAPWPDADIDPYWRERDYDTAEQGTFWGKFLARNPYHEGRLMRVYEGFLTHPFSTDNFRGYAFVIDQIKGVSKNNEVEWIGKDMLKLADDKKAQWPPRSPGTLSAGISDTATSLTLAPAGIGDDKYAAAGKVNIGGEYISFTRSGDVMTLTRAQSNTEAAAHDAGDTVQQVGIFDNELIQDVVYTLLTDGAGIDPAYIDKPAWDDEQAEYLAGVWSAEIGEPTGVNTLLGELTEQAAFKIWWDGYDQEIRFQAIRPLADDLPVYTDEDGVLEDLDISSDGKQRVSTVVVYFAQKSPAAKLDDLNNYQLRVGTPDLAAISWLEYGSNQIRNIYSRWFKKTSMGRVNALSDAILKTYRDPPKIMTARLDAALGLKVGDQFYVKTRKIQTVTGAAAVVPFEVIYAQPDNSGAIVKYKAQQVSTAIPLSNTRPVEISINTLDLNLYDAYVAEYGPAEPGITAVFTVLADVVVSSSSTATPALVPGDWPDGVDVQLVVLGIVAGRGGNGGMGQGDATPAGAENGDDGGTAIDATGYPITIDNTSGFIAGGGGGGGGGDLDGYLLGGTLYVCTGGGGGGGWPYGAGGTRGESTTGTYIHYGTAGSSPATDGLTGGYGVGGDAGAGVSIVIPGSITVASGAGGDGGYQTTTSDYDGDAGSIGTSHTVGTSPGVGGSQGACIVGDSNITWVATGSRSGTIT